MFSKDEKLNRAILAAIVFLIVSSPYTYDLTNGLFKSVFNTQLLEQSGCPNTFGLLVHALVFGVIVYILMSIY